VQLERFIDALEAELNALAAIGGDEESQAAAARLSGALRSAAGLRFLDVLSEAALELSSQLPSGHVEVRLAGQEPSLVFVESPEKHRRPRGREGLSARITLRLPEQLKATIELAATREGRVGQRLARARARAAASPVRDGASRADA
jgi:hypothetical protein